MIDLRNGDCLEVLRTLPDNSIDAIVTDPPYGLAFMGKRWDYDVPSVEIWAECLRVLKPGGHLLAFAGTRTQHRMAVRIEDAGFEIRDMIAWVYGSGFPKSLDVSKAIDKAAGAEREVVGLNKFASINGKANVNTYGTATRPDETAPATDAARQWEGWGTALKPALEPVTVARKPLAGTVAENVLAHGTGGLNIDGCRIGTSKDVPASVSKKAHANCYMGGWKESGETPGVGGHDPTIGRWPANLIHDGSEEVLAVFPHQKSPATYTREARAEGEWLHAKEAGTQQAGYGDTGSAARFFYCAKASAADRDDGVAGVAGSLSGRRDGSLGSVTMRKNTHPTVKPTDLMRYLCRLVTPPGGIVLDPFMGSGSTGKAAIAEGFRFIGIEREAEYVEIARARIAAVSAQGQLFWAQDDRTTAPDQPSTG